MKNEKEIKIMLEESQYNELIEEFSPSKQIRNINFYYDDLKKTMISNGRTVRVRTIGEIMYLQLKKHIDQKGNTNISEEFCERIEILPYCINSKTIFNLSGETYPDVYLLGFMVTDRTIYTLNPQVKILLDKNVFLNNLDYEIEIEYTCKNSDLESVINILKKHSINIQNNGRIANKSYRFSEKYYNQKW